ncbi:MAG: adenylate/guanylate cyclase domain-containing protein [Gallionella sp.]
MEERGNKTIMCSVFFLDIVEYSKKSVAGQISLKDRFNSYLSSAIRDVPMTDRIILDTGDGAAINFLGDVEDALKAALSLRESLLAEDPNVDPPLLVRMGINLGPVRLVRDINGQPNIVGDGINVAQRVMGFADAAQILVSRSYYDAVSRLSPQYAGMFHYQGSRTDKHVREHEVYAIGYPGDITSHRGAIKPAIRDQAEISLRTMLMSRSKMVWQYIATRFGALLRFSISRYQQADVKMRSMYIGVFVIALLLFITLLVNLTKHNAINVAENAEKRDVNDIQQGSTVSTATAGLAGSDAQTQAAGGAQTKSKPGKRKAAGDKGGTAQYQEARQHAKSQGMVEKNVAVSASSDGYGTHVQVSCKAGTEVFVDGERKGRIGQKSLTVNIQPGTHTVIVSNPNGGIFTQKIELISGKTVHIRPNFCD